MVPSLDLYQILIAIALAIPLAFFLTRFNNQQPPPVDESKEPYRQKLPTKPKMQAPQISGGSTATEPPKNDQFTPQDLSQYDGSRADGKIYVAVKGTVFDVTNKKEMYGPGGSYHVFAGKDASKALGLSSVKPEDAVADYSSLNEESLKTLDGWYDFFAKRYNIMGTVNN